MSIELLEQATTALGDLLDRVVFVGGATITLWITDPNAPPPRPTKDVDVVVEVVTRSAFHDFEAQLRRKGFTEDQQSRVICRWNHKPSALILDAMPADASILGFANRWQRAALPFAVERTLPSGAKLRAVSPPYLLATKIEAFHGRGRNDFLASADFEDIIALLDGREELAEEVRQADDELRAYVADELQRLIDNPRFSDGLFGALRPQATRQARAEAVVLPRAAEIIRAR